MEAIANILDLYADVQEQDLNEIAEFRVPRIIPADRSDPMAYLCEGEFITRYRLSKEAVRDLLREITPRLQRIRNNRGCSVPHQLQLLVALRYMASGNFQITMGDCCEMSTASVCKYVKIIAMATARQASHHIHFPEPDEARSLGSQFYDIAGMPGVIGCIDGFHVKIISPGRDNAETYRCRKGFMSLNVQGICDAQMKFINIVCSWPGSTHDARMFENSRMYAKLETHPLTVAGELSLDGVVKLEALEVAVVVLLVVQLLLLCPYTASSTRLGNSSSIRASPNSSNSEIHN
ncbi:hypothetical protein Pmani_019864 [Petrolisthes manimaculis]|uniref:DDE Tnp4 domain-containing protein n=1 Tax=Petrolisthes manimaculis TaxID=1843537 RepID=A0AAE1PHG5_9EUCA|nr:hypothetical protein Pmani_019864 [Petrolisthes manimaculis]